MSVDPRWLRAAARSLATGEPIDWIGLESHISKEERRVLGDLRLVAEVANAHRQQRGDDDPGPGAPRTVGAERPATWGELQIIERVGRGVYGDVYRARDPRLERDVALKLLRSSSPLAARAVIDEARLLARVRHSHVVTIHGADVRDGRVGLWMEYVRGRSLDQEVAERGPLSAQEAAVIGVDLCGALAAVHAAGVVHRDVKAGNVMREVGGRIILMDFGISWEQCVGGDPVGGGPVGGGLAGTPLYMAPEVLRGEPPTPASDLYSLGVLLYYLVTGSYPVAAGCIDDLRAAHAAHTPRALRDARPDLPARFVGVVERALAPAPGDRFASAGTMEAALSETLALPTPRSSVVGRLAASPAAGWLAAALVVALLVGGGVSLSRRWREPTASQRTLAFQPRDWLLITSFDNRSGNPRLDGTVDYALAREIESSHVVNVVPRERVRDALRLMVKPIDAPLDEETGREVCLRDGGIRALVSGRIDRLGTAYEISVRLLRPDTGEAVLAASAQAVGEDRVLAAVHDLADRLRGTLGEQRLDVHSSGERLEKVATPSLRALQFFSEGVRLLDQDAPEAQWREARALFEQATREDPGFATAFAYLSWTWGVDRAPDGGLRPEQLSASERAFRLADRATERERLFIRGTYFGQRKRRREAAAEYEALTRLYPDDYWAVSNLVGIYRELGPQEKVLPYSVRRAALRPNGFSENWWAFDALVRGGRADEARPYVERASSLAATLTEGGYELMLSRLQCFPVWQRWVHGDVPGAVIALSEASSKASRDGKEIFERSAWLVTFGQLRQADAAYVEALSKVTPPGAFRPLWTPEAALAWDALLRGDRPAARSWVRRAAARVEPAAFRNRDLLVFARVGATGEVTRALAAPGSGAIEDPGDLEHLRGEVALAEGRVLEARTLLARALDLFHPLDEDRMLTAGALAGILETEGRLEEALAVTTANLPARDRTSNIAIIGGETWLTLAAQRAHLLRRLGRPGDAAAIDATLRQLLACADADLLLLKWLGH